jgi:hypothetical protein
VAPNLTRVARAYTAAELGRVIRQGVRPNGESVQSMPSDMYFHMSDADVAKIIAFLRSKPVSDGPAYDFRPGPPLVRWEIVSGEWESMVDLVRRLGRRPMPPAAHDTVAVGEYIARTSYSECHGQDFKGEWGPRSAGRDRVHL